MATRHPRIRAVIGRTVFALLAMLSIASCSKLQGDSEAAHLARARDFQAKADYPSAVLEAKNALQKNPENLEARLLLGDALLQVGDGREAEIALRKAKELGADDNTVLASLGRAIILQGDYKRVLLDVVPTDGLTPVNEARIDSLRGDAQLEIGRFAEAARSFEKALTSEPTFGDAIIGQARIDIVGRKYDEAAAKIQQVLDRKPDDLRALLVRGDLYRELNKPDEALALYEDILKRHPYDLTSQVNVASILMLKGNFDEAARHIAVVGKIQGAQVMGLYLQALLEFRRQNYAAAREPIQKVLAVAPEHLPSLLLAGSIDYALNGNEQAEKYMRQALAIAPNVKLARKILAATLLRNGQIPQAVEMIRSAVTQSPNDPALMMLAGEIYTKAGDSAGAAKAFLAAAALDPKSVDARTRLALSRFSVGETDRAIADLESVVQLDPQDSKADVVVVVAYMTRHQYAEAARAVAVLERKQPNSPITYNLKGGVLLATKDVSGARAAFDKALALDPSYVPAASNLARLDLAEKKPDSARKRFTDILDRDPKNTEASTALVDLARSTGAPPAEILGILDRAVAADPKAVKPLVLLSRYALRTDPKKALETAKAAAAVSPNDPSVLEARGLAELANGLDSGALATFTRQAELQPNSPMAQYQLASVLVNSNPAAAARALRRALQLKPDFLDAQAALASIELNAGNVPEALKLARQAQTSVPDSTVGYLLEGDAQMLAKAYLKAAASYEKAYAMNKNGGIAVKIHSAYSAAGRQPTANARLLAWLKESPNDVGARLYLAAAAMKNRETSLAIEQYEAILAKEPDNAVVLNDLAFAYDQAKDPRAIATAERAYKLMPAEAPIADTLGWMLVQQGTTQRGLQLLRDASRTLPESSEIRMHLVQALLKSGDKAGARGELERLMGLRGSFPQRPEAEKLLASLQDDG